MNISTNKILITGCNGKIGRPLSGSLSQIGCDLILLANNPQYSTDSIHYLDIREYDRLDKIVSDSKPDTIIHLASLLPAQSSTNKEQVYDINVKATANLAKLAVVHGVKNFIFTSTSGIYNQQQYEPTDELNNIDPKSIYARSKLLAEHNILKIANKQTTTKFSIFRVFNVYGPGFEDSLINKLAKSNENNVIELYGPDNYYRDYIHISDLIRIFEKWIKIHNDANFQTVNIGNGIALNNTNVINNLRKLGYNPHFIAKQTELSVSWANIEKLRSLINYSPRLELLDPLTFN